MGRRMGGKNKVEDTKSGLTNAQLYELYRYFGNMTKAAKLVGISRQGYSFRLKQYSVRSQPDIIPLDMERVLWAYTQTGNTSLIARKFGIHRHTVDRRIVSFVDSMLTALDK